MVDPLAAVIPVRLVDILAVPDPLEVDELEPEGTAEDAVVAEDAGAEEASVLPEVVELAGAPGAETCIPFPIVLTVEHCDLAGAGCAEGVDAWPWWNVDVPYTPIGYRSRCKGGRNARSKNRKRPTSPESPRHESKEPAE